MRGLRSTSTGPPKADRSCFSALHKVLRWPDLGIRAPVLNCKYLPFLTLVFVRFFFNILSEPLSREALKSFVVLLSGPGNSRGKTAYHIVTGRQRSITDENYRLSRGSPPQRDGTMTVLSALAMLTLATARDSMERKGKELLQDGCNVKYIIQCSANS